MATRYYAFPPGILRAVPAMYAAPRRVSWGTTYSQTVRTMTGALPGYTMTMYRLQLFMMIPVDVFSASLAGIRTPSTSTLMVSRCKS
eukprot:786696-Pyramimonas_sp.AAC.1